MPSVPCPNPSFAGYYPFFPSLFDDQTDTPRACYDDLVQKRRVANMLPTSAAWSFREVIEKKTSPPHPGARPMPSFAREGGTFLFQLVWAEQGAEQTADEDAWQYSQVWVADVTKGEEIEAVAQPERVVLKIFQPSMLPLPFPDTGYQYVPGPAYQLAFSEEVVYTQLRRLQGSHIPYFFGTFKMILPCGEEAYVLMLEYIDGETLDSWVTDFDDEKLAVLPAVIKSIPDAFREICEERVLHTDMEKHLNNILIDKDGRAVIIDFVQNAIFDSAEQVKEEVLYRSGDEDQGSFCVRVALKRCLESASTPETKVNLERWLNVPGHLPSKLEWPNGPEKPVRSNVTQTDSDDDDDSSDEESESSEE